MNFLILPHQLFDKKYLDKNNTHYIWEHPHYFTKYNYNKKKLVLHRASLQYYYQYLKNLNFKVKYIEYTKKLSISEYTLFDPIDKLDLCQEYIESPNFLLDTSLLSQYREKTDHYLFNNFYEWSKKQLQIIPNIKSKDKMNRKVLPKDLTNPDLPLIEKSDQAFIDEACSYVNKHFESNYGHTNNFIFPISHRSARKWLNDWIRIKFKNFGDYQDSFVPDTSYLFHSVLSSSINIGLLNPGEIIEQIMKVQSKIPVNSFEGYVRQLFWREYQRYCYIYYNFNMKNYLKLTKKLNKKWYVGTLGILPVDDCIKKAFDTGYLNHIERLMVVGNFMVLSNIHPKQGFKWFMEFSCDSYEWVMCQNVYDMVFFVSGGVTMRRPYVSSSAYVIKMSSYQKDTWCKQWDQLYADFKKKKHSELWKFRYFFGGLKKK